MGLIPLVGANEHPCHLEKIFHIPGMVWSTFPILSHNPFWFFFNPYLIIPARQILLSSLLKKTRLKLLRPLIQHCSESLAQSEFKFKSEFKGYLEGDYLVYFTISIEILKWNHALIFLFHCLGCGRNISVSISHFGQLQMWRWLVHHEMYFYWWWNCWGRETQPSTITRQTVRWKLLL